MHYNPGEDRFKLFQQAFITTHAGNWTIDLGKFALHWAGGYRALFQRQLLAFPAVCVRHPLLPYGHPRHHRIGSGLGCSDDADKRLGHHPKEQRQEKHSAALTYSDDRFSFVQNVITGDEAVSPARGARTVWDTVLFYKTGADKYGVNFDYGEDKSAWQSGWDTRCTTDVRCRETVHWLCATPL